MRTKRGRLLLPFWVLIGLVVCSPLGATIISVPADSSTIQGGIDGTQDGDTVLVAPGRYLENLDFKGKAIYLTSEVGPDSTVIDGDSILYHPVVSFVSGEDTNSVLDGFTITRGYAPTGAGIRCLLGSFPKIVNNIITRNCSYDEHSFYGFGAGIYSDPGSLIIRDNIITQNKANYAGGIYCAGGSPLIEGNEVSDNSWGGMGIYAEAGDQPLIINNRILNNEGCGIGTSERGSPLISNNTISGNRNFISPESFGGGISSPGESRPIIVDNIITGNKASARGGGIGTPLIGGCSILLIKGNYIAGDSAFEGGGIGIIGGSDDTLTVIEENIVEENEAVCGGGISVVGGAREVRNNIIRNNRAFNQGGGIHVQGSEVIISNNQIVSNVSDYVGGGVFTYFSCWTLPGYNPSSFVNNLIADNSASEGGGFFLYGSTAVITNNTIAYNQASERGGGIYDYWAGATIANNIIVGSRDGEGILAIEKAPPIIFYNDVWGNADGDYSGCLPGEGDISLDPLFADTSLGDYHLLVNSPCIDRGDTTWEFRDPDSSRNDIGAYGGPWAIMARPVYPKGLKAEPGDSTVSLSWRPNPEGDIWWYAIYRSDSSGFFPSESTLIAQVEGDPAYVDSQVIYGNTYYYQVSAVNGKGYGSGYSKEVKAKTGVQGREEGRLPTRFSLSQNYPNPFNSATTLHSTLPQVIVERFKVKGGPNTSHLIPITLKVYNILGQLVRTLMDEEQAPGYYSVRWDGRNDFGKEVSSGIYFCRLEVIGDRLKITRTRKMVLIR